MYANRQYVGGREMPREKLDPPEKTQRPDVRWPDLSLRKIENHGIGSPFDSLAECFERMGDAGTVERVDPNSSQRPEERSPLQLPFQHDSVKRSARTQTPLYGSKKEPVPPADVIAHHYHRPVRVQRTRKSGDVNSGDSSLHPRKEHNVEGAKHEGGRRVAFQRSLRPILSVS